MPVVRADGLEADREQVVDREDARGRGPLLVPEGLDRPYAAPGEGLRHALNEHAAEAATGKLAEHPRGHEQHGVRAHRARREGDGPGHVLWGSVENISGRHAVDVKELSATAPFKEHRGDTRLLF